MVYNALAGTAAGLLYGLSLEQIKAGIESNGSLSGRFNIISTPRYTIIDDCYNASPVSMKASLEVLQDGANRRIAILGDMGELGADERKLHSQVGRFAAALNIDALYCAGDLSTEIAQAAVNGGFKGEVKHYDTRDALIAALPGLLHHGDTILVKASHFMQFPAIVSWLQDN